MSHAWSCAFTVPVIFKLLVLCVCVICKAHACTLLYRTSVNGYWFAKTHPAHWLHDLLVCAVLFREVRALTQPGVRVACKHRVYQPRRVRDFDFRLFAWSMHAPSRLSVGKFTLSQCMQSHAKPSDSAITSLPPSDSSSISNKWTSTGLSPCASFTVTEFQQKTYHGTEPFFSARVPGQEETICCWSLQGKPTTGAPPWLASIENILPQSAVVTPEIVKITRPSPPVGNQSILNGTGGRKGQKRPAESVAIAGTEGSKKRLRRL